MFRCACATVAGSSRSNAAKNINKHLILKSRLLDGTVNADQSTHGHTMK
jgi:hypothetical protein